MVEPRPSNDARLPDRSMMSVCEVITWIAFRRAIPSDGLDALFRASHTRWGTFPPDRILAAMEARAGVAGDGPFHPVWIPDRPRSRDEVPYQDRILTPEGPAILRSIRARLRRATGRLLGYAELAVMLRDDIEADARLSASLQAARDELRDRAAGGRITVYGIPKTGPGLTVKSPLPEAVPASLFMHPEIVITVWNEVQPDTSRPLGEWLGLRVPEYEQVQFRTAEILALWPHSPSDAPYRRNRIDVTMTEPVVTLNDLPAAWTVMECVAWIVLRDPGVVRNCNPQWRAAIRSQAHRAAPGETVSGLRLDLLQSWNLAEFPTSVGCSAATASDDLSNALAKGEMVASGIRPDGIRVVMDPADWRGLVLREGDGRIIDAEPIDPTTPHVWRGVSIKKVDIISRWPPDGGERLVRIEAEPQSASAAENTRLSKTRYNERLLRAEYLVRVERWRGAGAEMAPPSPDDDRLWAALQFDHAPRQALRKVRRDLAPESWKKRGKRTGMKWHD